MPVRLHCGSASTITTRWPRSASIHPRLKQVVVLLTPPLLLNRAITLATRPPSDRSERNGSSDGCHDDPWTLWSTRGHSGTHHARSQMGLVPFAVGDCRRLRRARAPFVTWRGAFHYDPELTTESRGHR